MTYATQADLETRFSTEELAQRTDRIDGSVIDADVVARALADAEAEIDGYLAKRYQLPLATVPPMLARLACDIARYYLYDDCVIEVVRKRYEDSVRLLKALASGEVTLDAAVILEAAPSGIAVTSRSPERVFNADRLADY